ncbi:hypothetical protein HPB51_001564 [Rhipicephalus microplus]|uniref:Uncharacterized protein n=1 Tax=Rhipicephalus microplus TaxID=6941 RepID=A0A9J6EW06_RHIMP|nr:hypothetical protein HPB51_001564 [Rhipicephalus microplus]
MGRRKSEDRKPHGLPSRSGKRGRRCKSRQGEDQAATAVQQFLAVCTGAVQKACDRSIWAFRRNERWFEGTVPHLGEQNFKQSFRVYPSTFRFIVESLRSELERQFTSMRETITPEKRVGIALYKLCLSTKDRTVANLFGVGRSTVNTLYRQFCEAVVAVLEHEWIKMVTAEEMARHIQEFEAVTGTTSTSFSCSFNALVRFSISSLWAASNCSLKSRCSFIIFSLISAPVYFFRFLRAPSPLSLSCFCAR